MQIRTSLFSLAALASLGASAFGGTSANLILNPSFETPVVPANSFIQPKAIYGWWGQNGIEIQSNYVLGAGMGTSFGNQYAELNVEQPSKLVQFVKTTPGQKYNLSFYYAERPGTGTNTISVFFGSSFANFSLPSTSTLTFKQFSESVTATKTITELSFNPLQSTSAGAGNELDNISLTAVSSAAAAPSALAAAALGGPRAVPLPGAFAAGMFGLLGLAAFQFARRRTA